MTIFPATVLKIWSNRQFLSDEGAVALPDKLEAYPTIKADRIRLLEAGDNGKFAQRFSRRLVSRHIS